MYLAIFLDVFIPSISPFTTYFILWNLDRKSKLDVLLGGLFFDLVFHKFGIHLFLLFFFFFLFRFLHIKNLFLKNTLLFLGYFHFTYFLFGYSFSSYLSSFLFGLFSLLFYGYIKDKL